MNTTTPPYTLKQSTRSKRASLRVINQEIIVTAPKCHPKESLDEFVLEKIAWIQKQMRQQVALEKHQDKQRFEFGGEFLFLGETITLTSADIERPTLTAHELALPKACQDTKSIQAALYDWYQRQAQELLTQKTEHVAAQLEQNPPLVQLGKFKSKWGSCHYSDKTAQWKQNNPRQRHPGHRAGIQKALHTNDWIPGRARDDASTENPKQSCALIKYSWPIMQAPEQIIDYLVTHEVAHMIEMNHSTKFWAIVESLCPTYKARRKWLREQSRRLSML